MLDLVGTIGANVLSLPGILGLALGMMTRSALLGAALGGFVGIVETLVFAGFQLAQIDIMEFVIAILVGTAAGALGSALRIKGTTI